MNEIFANLESFLLPSPKSEESNANSNIPIPITETNRVILNYKKKPKQQSDIPTERLEFILQQVSILDHLRNLQTTYRDNHDDQFVGIECRSLLDYELFGMKDKVIDKNVFKLPVKLVIDKIIEERTRVIPLVNLCYGGNSVEMIRSQFELANIYAINGLWPKVEELTSSAIEKLIVETSKSGRKKLWKEKRLNGLEAASRISIVYSVLRDHTLRNNGTVDKSFITELVSVFSQFKGFDSDNNKPIRSSDYISKIASSLSKFFILSDEPTNYNISNNDIESLLQTKNKSWGSIIDYFRNFCPEMKQWVQDMNDFILPHNKSILWLPFRFCDMQNRGIAHPLQLSNSLSRFPLTTKLLAGSDLKKQLTKIKVELPITITLPPSSSSPFKNNSNNDNNNVQHIVYELPITEEEYLCKYLLESDNIFRSEGNQLDLIQMQLLTLQGVVNIYNEKLTIAQEYLQSALQVLGAMGLEMELLACELYNSIAQMMIMKYKKWMASKKSRLKELAADWLKTEEGYQLYRNQLRIIKKEYNYTSKPISKAELEFKAKDFALKKRINYLFVIEKNGNTQPLDAAYRYLVKSFEVMETHYGSVSPFVGTACLAVASIQNLAENMEDTREWLMMSLRSMEKFEPPPIRSITFTQTQLSQVLLKLGFIEESKSVLTKAAMFHMSEANIGVILHAENQSNNNNNDYNNSEIYSNNNITRPILKNTSLFEELELASDLMEKVIKMNIQSKDLWQAAQQAEELCALNEKAFGWDSVQAQSAYKQVGIRYSAVSDWKTACKYFKHNLETCTVLFGKSDPKTTNAIKLLKSAKDNRKNNNKKKPISEIDDIIDSPRFDTVNNNNDSDNYNNNDNNNNMLDLSEEVDYVNNNNYQYKTVTLEDDDDVDGIFSNDKNNNNEVSSPLTISNPNSPRKNKTKNSEKGLKRSIAKSKLQ